jgi:hypothetical protein
MTVIAKFLSTDRDTQTLTHWFSMHGKPWGLAVKESGEFTLVDGNGAPMNLEFQSGLWRQSLDEIVDACKKSLEEAYLPVK